SCLRAGQTVRPPDITFVRTDSRGSQNRDCGSAAKQAAILGAIMRFVKMQGCGNDYVYVDCVRQPPPRDPAGLARVISDRHFGVRCVAKYVHDHGIAVKPRLTIETGRGVLTLDLEVRDGKVERVTVDMGQPILDADKIPTTLPGNPPVNVSLFVPPTSFDVTC